MKERQCACRGKKTLPPTREKKTQIETQTGAWRMQRTRRDTTLKSGRGGGGERGKAAHAPHPQQHAGLRAGPPCDPCPPRTSVCVGQSDVEKCALDNVFVCVCVDV